MKTKRTVELKKLLTPTDAFAVAVIIIGLLIAIFIPETAIRLIGISIIILGVVALFMMLSQRLSEIVETRETRFNPQQSQNLKVSVKKDTSAKRLVFEDFQESLAAQEPKTTIPPEVYSSEIKGDEGFRFIKKIKESEQTKTSELQATQPAKNSPEVIIVTPPAIEIEQGVAETISEFADPPKNNVNDNYADDITSDSSQNDSGEEPEMAVESSRPEPKITINISKPNDSIIDEITEQDEEDEENEGDAGLENGESEPALRQDELLESETQMENSEQVSQINESYKEKQVDLSITDIMEDVPSLSYEPRKELEYFLNRMLLAVRSVINARTAAFMFVNHDKREISIESLYSDSENLLTDTKVFRLGKDIVSQIALSRQPEILTEINPTAELDLIPYYKEPAGTQSFIGVPVFYNDIVIGVCCADTHTIDAYDSITISFLGHFTKLITALIQSYTEKYDLLQASRALEAINLFRAISSEAETSSDVIIESAVKAVSKLLDYSTVGICGYDQTAGWVVKSVISSVQDNNRLAGNPVFLDSSMIGKSLLSGETVVLSPIESTEVRVHHSEGSNMGGFFVSVPLKSSSTSYGAIFVEGANTSSLTNFDIRILETLAEHAASNIEKMLFWEMLQSSSMIDNATGLYNPAAFYRRLDEEFLRCVSHKINATLCLFQIDKYASLDPDTYHERNERALYHVISIIRKHLDIYHVFGKADVNTFGILLTEEAIDKAKFWAERVRNEIAVSPLEINGKNFVVTISMGISDVPKADTSDTMIANARKALDQSLIRTNYISSYS